ncbi:MAG: hypothetical protein H6772_02230 [Pseudomonadales bacterium]|nr:hypothetical protein [Pseudomonadales bacterium]
MKNSLIIGGAIIFIFILINLGSGSRNNSYKSEVSSLKRQVSDLEYEISDLERCKKEFQYAIDSAKSNLESGYYQDAYYDLDGIETFCQY